MCCITPELSSRRLSFRVNSNFLLLLLFCYDYNGCISVVSGMMTVMVGTAGGGDVGVHCHCCSMHAKTFHNILTIKKMY